MEPRVTLTTQYSTARTAVVFDYRATTVPYQTLDANTILSVLNRPVAKPAQKHIKAHIDSRRLKPTQEQPRKD